MRPPSSSPLIASASEFNRPDIVKLVLETLDEDRAIDEARRANVKRCPTCKTSPQRAVEDVRAIAPPIVVIQKPRDDTTFRTPEVTLEYNIFSGDRSKEYQSLTSFSTMPRSAPVSSPPADAAKTTSLTGSNFPCRPRTSPSPLLPVEGERASEPASIRLRWDGAKPGQVRAAAPARAVRGRQ